MVRLRNTLPKLARDMAYALEQLKDIDALFDRLEELKQGETNGES